MYSEVEKKIKALDRMNGLELRAAYIEVFNERPHSHRHQWLKRRIAWGIQAKAEGGWSERFIAEAQKADLTELRVMAPGSSPIKRKKQTEPKTGEDSALDDTGRDPRIPKPGTVLEREFKGRQVRITIKRSGFEWDGKVYASFSAAVKAATGASYSPYVFFKLGAKPKS
ncbi:DUF2924 domain-containing protein [Sulfidibacter corallicola]|uniref:DUF2924 domain-containing protein n=1 Tax=Sulfidibacter corallicola TaxID=2818388 RepID=A0A8A4TY62_SULCO|nr:DUF2924 domain-containing protein [Sulfidibacter corallicola]QTD54158.1 DUF2924 domain-containing protein [Sulfidibacter corallicola]